MGSVLAVDTIGSTFTYKPPQIKNASLYSTYGSWTCITTTALKSSTLNLASVTDNGTGDTTVTFTRAFNDTNYPVEGGAADDTTVRAAGACSLLDDIKTTTANQMRVADDGSNALDSGDVLMAIAGYIELDFNEPPDSGSLILSAPNIILNNDSLSYTFINNIDLGTSTTWSAASLGAADNERYIVTAFMIQRASGDEAVSFDSLTINGVVGTWDISISTGPFNFQHAIAIGHAKVPTGTTGDIVYGISAFSINATAAATWRVISTNIGATTLQLIDTLTEVNTAPTDGTILDAADLISWNNGVAFISGVARNGLGWSATAAGLTEDYDFDTNFDEWFSGYSRSTDGTATDVEILEADPTPDEILGIAITYGP